MEANKVRMNMDGSIRAKVLQYKADGNTLTEKQETLKKFAEGIYFTTEEDGYGNTIHGIVFEEDGVFWWSRQALRPNELTTENYFCQRIMENRRNFFADIATKAANNGFISTLEIEVHKRLGEDIAQLVASREAYLKRREEEEREKAETAKRREQEREEAEKRRKAQLLAEGKEKLLNHEAITVEQIELIAEAVGYTIHGRTLGFMREKISEAILKADGVVTVWGRKLSQRNINGTADVIRELAERVKAQAEAEAKQTATATETPQISTEAAETVKCTAEVENKPKRKAKYHYHELRQKREISPNFAKRTEWIIGAETGPDGLYFKIEWSEMYYSEEYDATTRQHGTYWLSKSELRDKLQGPKAPQSPQIPTEATEAVNYTTEGETVQETTKNMGQVELIKINRTGDNMYCVGMYINGVLVDCVNGITEAEKNDYKRLYERGKLLIPNYQTSTQPPETPPKVNPTTEAA